VNRLAPFLVFVAVAAAGCVHSEPRNPTPQPQETPVNIVLQPDVPQALIMASGPVAVRLAEVNDSRCPKGAHCIQAGEGRITLAVDGDGYGSYRLELSTTDEVPVYLNKLGCKLESLDPYPRAGSPADPGAYRATLLFYGAALPEPPDEAQP